MPRSLQAGGVQCTADVPFTSTQPKAFAKDIVSHIVPVHPATSAPLGS